MNEVARPRAMSLSEARTVVDDALVALATAEDELATRREAVRVLSEALSQLDAAIADPEVFHERTASARDVVGDLLSVLEAQLGPGAAQSPSASLLARSLEALAGIRWEAHSAVATARARESTGPLRASIGEPGLLDLARGPIIPLVPVLGTPQRPALTDATALKPANEPPSLSLAELDAAIAAAERESEPEERIDEEAAQQQEDELPRVSDGELESAYFGNAITREEQMHERARNCLEDLALLGAVRRPLPDQGWAGREEAERRLLTRLDAIMACGESVLPSLVAMVEERPVPDPQLTWALVFLYGSIAGDDAAEEAMRLARVAPRRADGMVDALADAFALAAHPGLSPRLAAWLSDPAPERREIAIRALSRRGALSPAQALAATADAEPRVIAAAAAALATTTGPAPSELLWNLAHHSEAVVVEAALQSALARGIDVAVRRARKLLEEGKPDLAGAAMTLAIAGEADDLELLQAAAASGSTLAIEALGWFGDPAAVEDLLGRLESDAAPSALEALQRITAASLTDADPAPEYPEGNEPFAASDGPMPHPIPLCTDPNAWRTWWNAHGKRAPHRTRHRFGHLYTPADSLRELEHPLSTPRSRRLAQLELCARLGARPRVDLEAFVARQRRQLAEWRQELLRHRATPGEWSVRLGR